MAGNVYYSLAMQTHGTVSSPPVILQNGTAGISTIYTNSTSAEVRVTGYPYDFVDNDVANVDSSSDRGTHSNFTAQQYGPDSVYDALTEENTKGIEDYVDQLSDEDSSADRGSHSNFENQKNRDSSYDTLTEATAVGGNWGDDTPQGTSTTVSNCRLMGGISPDIDDMTLKNVSIYISGTGSVRLAVYQGGSLVSGPVGATLVYDFGTVTPSGVGWITATGANVSLAKNEVTWIGWKGNDNTVNVFYDTTWDSGSDFQSGNGRFDSSGESTDETDGWDSTLPSGGSYSAYWYSAYLTYDVPTNYRLDLEAQFTNITDFLPTEKLCIYTGTIGSEDVEVDYWNGTDWENVATALTANSWNNYTVSLTSTTFTVRFKDAVSSGDTTQDQWQIDASLLRVGGAGSKEDAVDNDTSDVDSSADLGNLINFDNMNATDSTYANLTESTPGGIAYINEAEASATSGTSAQINKPTNTEENDFMIALLVSTIGSDTDGSTMSSAPSGWTSEHNYTQSATSGQHVYIYWKIAGASEPSSYTWTWTDSCGWVAQITTFRNVDTASPIHVEGTVNQETSTSPMSPSVTTTEDNCVIWLYDMCDNDEIPAGGGYPSGTSWIDQTEVTLPGNGLGISTAYFLQASAGATGNRDWALGFTSEENSGQQYALKPAPTNYRLDQEIQWIGVPYILPNENLSIYGGTMGTEDLKVDVWNGTGWETVFTDLSSGWNNASITGWLTTSNFTIRFKGGAETGDTNQTTWEIDAALIHVWNAAGEENYELDLEVQWANVDYTQTNEELCIKTGTTDAEDIKVDVWNGSAWTNVFTDLTADSWNNVSVTSYLTSSDFTIRFNGGSETSDTSQGSWNIDATLLHIWTGGSTWLSGWGKRVKMTIDHNDIDSSLPDFPVLVYLSNSSGRNNDDVAFVFDEVGSNSKKIAVTKSDGTTQCYVEIEKWDAASEQAWLWVKAPSISSTTDTDLYLYYDSSQSDNTAYIGDKESTPAENVWDSSFKGVWHLDEDPSGTAPQMKDSTPNNNDGTSNGIMTSGDQVSGKIDGSLDFEGTDDYIQTTSSELKTLDNFTLSVWFKADSTTAPQHMLWEGPASQNGWGDGSSPSSHEMHLTICKFDANNTLNFFYGYEESGGDFTPAVEINVSFSDITNWNHAVVVMTGAGTSPSAELFLNGVSQGTDTGTQTNRTAWDTNLRIGRPGVNQRYFDGMIDEVQILETAKSVTWVKASYESGRDDLLDFASEEGTNYVDNNTSDVGSPTDKGTHSNFTAQQYGPDSVYDTLIEEDTAGGIVYENSAESYSATLQSSHNFNYSLQKGSGNERLVVVTVSWEDAQASASISSLTFNGTAMIHIVNVTVSIGYSEYISLWYLLDSALPSSPGSYNIAVTVSETIEREIYVAVAEYSGVKQTAPDDFDTDANTSPGNTAITLTAAANESLVVAGVGEGGTNVLTNTTDISNLQEQIFTSCGSALGHNTNVNSGDITVGWNNLDVREGMAGAVWQPASTYELDLEVQWTNASYTQTNEELCIKTGTTDAEDIKVDVWNGSAWTNVFTDLTADSWNNVSVTSYLTSSDFTIRFNGGSETSDTSQGSWNIDATLLHIWTDKGTSEGTCDYVLRVNNTGADSWQVRLKKYSDSNISRLQECSIYFHNSTDGTSSQIDIQDGSYTSQTGPWYDLGNSETIYIAITVQANSTATSYVYTYLEILVPNITTYIQYMIAFEIT